MTVVRAKSRRVGADLDAPGHFDVVVHRGGHRQAAAPRAVHQQRARLGDLVVDRLEWLVSIAATRGSSDGSG